MNNFSFDKDLQNKKKRDEYRDSLFALARSSTASKRALARKDIKKLYNHYTNSIDRNIHKKKFKTKIEELFSPDFVQQQINFYYQADDVAIKQSIVSSLYYAVLCLTPVHTELFVDFLCDVATQKSGNVRKAAVSLGTWIGFGADTRYLKDPTYHPNENTSRDESLTDAQRAHLRLVEQINILIQKNDIGYPKPFNWSDLTPSVYKSLYMLLEIVTRCWNDYAYETYKKESGIDPEDPDLDKILYVEDKHGSNASDQYPELPEDIFQNIQTQPQPNQFIWDEQTGVISGQTMADGVFVGTGAGSIGQLLRFYVYVPIDESCGHVSTDDKNDFIRYSTYRMREYLDVQVESASFTEKYIEIVIRMPWDTAPQTVTDKLIIQLYKAAIPVYYCAYTTNTEKPHEKTILKELDSLVESYCEMDVSLLDDTTCFEYVHYNIPPVNDQQDIQLDSFQDQLRVSDHFFKVLETPYSSALDRCMQLREVLASDPDFLDTYSELADAYSERCGKKKCNADGFTSEAYRRACLLISSKDGSWPKQMSWAWQENRHIMRALAKYAYLMWEHENPDTALDIFRRLLLLNPNDNQGARYEILALRLNLPVNWHDEFAAVDHPDFMNARQVDDWFVSKSKKFPKDFNGFWEFVKKQEES